MRLSQRLHSCYRSCNIHMENSGKRNMLVWTVFAICTAAITITSACDNVTIVSRAEWGARPSKEINYMGTPVGVVFIHHTAMEECMTQKRCSEEMQTIQNYHMDTRGWDDIGYNFLIGEDGKAYEARGWDRIGAHTKGWNDVAVAFSVMGDYTNKLPNTAALDAVQRMIDCGVKLGKITRDYKMYGHRDVKSTECPGERFYQLIRTWDHYDTNIPVKPSPLPYKG